MEFFATTAKGMEEVLAKELSSVFNELSGEFPELREAKVAAPTRAGVPFSGPVTAAYAACLWSRIANRVLFPIHQFPAPTPEKLYGGAKAIRWSDHLDVTSTLAVDFQTSHSTITHSQFGAQKTKDAIVDQLRSVHGERPNVDLVSPDIRVNVYLRNDEASLAIDLSGSSLHARGYRSEQREAPLKENLAAAILLLADYREIAAKGGALVDPMCGSGTIPLEAALIATNTAPGLSRKRWGFTAWKKHDAKIWERLLKHAESVRELDPKKLPKIVGFDTDPTAITAALANLESAGLRGVAHFEKRELDNAEAPVGAETGLFILNPPYGERLGDEEELVPLYRRIGDTMKKKFKGWKGGILTGSSVLAKEVGLKATRRHVLFNGAIECRFLTYDLYGGSRDPKIPRAES
jgi:23S rRNA (guanine2445-N2)-methyltransferase / 23S rRNA (guanine2069-N7)-methyltransferase